MNQSMTFQLNWNLTGKTVNGRQYSASSLSRQMREMVKNKELFITKKIAGKKGITQANTFASVVNVKYNRGRLLFETVPLSPVKKKNTPSYVSVQGMGILDDDNKVKNFRLLNLFLTKDNME